MNPKLLCPLCNKPIPEYRLDDPYCDCGYNSSANSGEIEELSWVAAIVAVVVVCVLQVLILFVIHLFASTPVSMLDNLLFNYFGSSLVTFMHYFIIISMDTFILGLIYVVTCYYLGRKTSHPIMLASIFGVIAVVFKFFVIDPRSDIAYPFLGYVQNIVLIALCVMSGIVTGYIGYNRKRF